MSKSRITTLDGIRGLAILLVLGGHVAQNYPGIDEGARAWLMAFANSNAGVRLFFVLSGYLITTLIAAEFERTGTISLRDFYRRRAVRILPAFYVFLSGALLLAVLRSAPVVKSAFAAAGLFVWNYALPHLPVDEITYWDLGHLWTLALEQQFYVFWPLVLLWLGPDRAIRFAVLLAVWCPVARVGTYFLFPAQRGYLGMMLHTAVDSIMIGCAAALWLRSATGKRFIRDHARLLVTVGVGWLFVLSPVLATVIHGFPAAAGFTVDAVAAACLIAGSHLAPGPRTAAILGRGVLPALGLVSYSLYLWQQVFLAPTRITSGFGIVLALAGALVAATLSYFLVEQPMLKLRIRRTQPAAAVPEAS